MKHSIIQNQTLAGATTLTWSVNLPVVDDLYLRTTQTSVTNQDVLYRNGQLEVSVTVTGPNGNKTLYNSVPLTVIALRSDHEGGEAIGTETDDSVVKIELGHIAFQDGEELEIKIQNLHATVGVILDCVAVCNMQGPSRILCFQQTQDSSKLQGDVLEIWIVDYTLTAGVGCTLNDISTGTPGAALVTVKGGRVSDTLPLEMHEAITRVDGEAEQFGGLIAKVYDCSENGGLPVAVACDIVGTATGGFRTIWVTELDETPAIVAARSRRELLEHQKSLSAVPTARKSSLRAKGML